MSSNLVEKTIPILRMDCAICIPLLEREINHLVGVQAVKGNYLDKTLKVTYNPGIIHLSEIESKIERLGYRISYKKYLGIISKLRRILKRESVENFESLTDASFTEKVLHNSKIVAILFTSPSCPICHIFKKEFQDISEKIRGKTNLYEMDITSTETWQKFDITSIPTILIFKSGNLIKSFQALPNSEKIIETLFQLMQS